MIKKDKTKKTHTEGREGFQKNTQARALFFFPEITPNGARPLATAFLNSGAILFTEPCKTQTPSSHHKLWAHHRPLYTDLDTNFFTTPTKSYARDLQLVFASNTA